MSTNIISHKVTVKEIAGKGLGTVAIQPIAAGEMVISEEPLLVIPSWSESCLMVAFDKLSSSKQVDLLSLSNSQHSSMSCIAGVAITNMLPLADPGAYGVFKNISRVNHNCLPNCNHYQVLLAL
jgi:hypothetical protein